MGINAQFRTWNLQEIVSQIHLHHPEITKIYLFGSRAYKTNSLRSDIDLLAITDGNPISLPLVNGWLHSKYPPVDLFCSYDSNIATSVINGSHVKYDEKNKWNFSNLIEQLDAKLLWNKEEGFSTDFSDWNQQTLNGINFTMSVIPSYAIPDFNQTVEKALASLQTIGMKPYYSGSSWSDISKSIIKLIEVGLRKPATSNSGKKVTFSLNDITIKNEYDFQNLIHLLLRPIYPDIAPEPFEVTIDGNKKFADFALMGNKIIIEAKWVDTNGKKNDVLKTIAGLTEFYCQNPSACSLIFLILHSSKVDIDPDALSYLLSREKLTPPVFVHFLESDYTD